MAAESAVKALRQQCGGQKVDTYRCNANCNQGRACPTRQACEIKELDDEDRASNKALLWGLAACAALVCLCVIFRPFFK